MLGQHLGEYVVRRYIGSGGMGLVYEGEHLTIGRKVAIKLLREEPTQGARGLLAEARAASTIHHPGIIDIFGFGQQPGVGQYLIMEYLEGHPLDELIRARAPLPLPEAFALLGEVLDALSAAHAAGVIHRDLKPSNIFVARQSNGTEYIKVLDFGLAKRSTTSEGTAPQTRSDVIVGTPQYMAPEQALHKEVGPRTDLYAVGVIAFELLTGQRPFTGCSHMEILSHHLRTPPLAPSLFVALPPGVDALILRLLAKEPEERPGSASEVARELRALLSRQESPSPPPLARSSRSSPVIQSPREAAIHQDVTETLRPSLARPGLEAEQRPVPPRRGSLWRWGAVVGGLLTLVLGAGVVMPRESAEPAPPAESPPSSAPGVSTSAPGVSTPLAEAPPLAAPAPMSAAPAERGGTASAPARKKVAASPRQPAAAPIVTLQPPSAPPVSEPQPEPQQPAAGSLHLVVSGAWVDVWVDGRKLGRVPPMNTYTLTSGEHELELRNPGLSTYRRTLVISTGDTLVHTVDLEPEAQSPTP
jgi:serine/threonine-protein kinase